MISGIAVNSIYNTQNKVSSKMVVGNHSPIFSNQTQNYFNRNVSEHDLSKEFGLNVEKVNVKAQENKKDIDIFQLFTKSDMDEMPKEDILWVINQLQIRCRE